MLLLHLEFFSIKLIIVSYVLHVCINIRCILGWYLQEESQADTFLLYLRIYKFQSSHNDNKYVWLMNLVGDFL